MRLLTRWTALATLAACAGCTPATADLALTPSEIVVATDRLDLDGDSRADELVFVNDTVERGPARYSRIVLGLSRSGVASWPGDGDTTAVRQVSGHGSLLIRFGPGYGCCAPALTIAAVTASGLRPVLAFEQFAEAEPRLKDPAGIARLVGHPCLAEPVGGGTSYQPTLVVVLDSAARIDSVESIRRTTLAQGGLDGLDCSSQAVSVLRADGTRVLRRP